MAFFGESVGNLARLEVKAGQCTVNLNLCVYIRSLR
jgi:hypothetical protein